MKLLAFANLAIGNTEEAENYILFFHDLVDNNKKLDKEIDILKRIESQKEALSEVWLKNPFTYPCKCEYCRFVYPKKIYKMMSSFYVS